MLLELLVDDLGDLLGHFDGRTVKVDSELSPLDPHDGGALDLQWLRDSRHKDLQR